MLLTKEHHHAKMNVVITRGIKRIWESKMRITSLVSIIQDVDLALKALEMVYHANGAVVEGLADRNVHRSK